MKRAALLEIFILVRWKIFCLEWEAAFVDIGLERNAFLYAGDLNQADSDLPINKLLRKGEQILVQVTKSLKVPKELGYQSVVNSW